MTTITTESGELRDEASQRHSLQQACRCAVVADDYRGGDTVVLDLTGVTRIADYFVITTGTSRRQMHAVADEIDREMVEAGNQRIGVEGYHGDTWILQDYGDIVVHVFNSETRSLYDLEHLWADAAKVDWQALTARDS